MSKWPYNEDDHMEIGTSGWVPVGEGLYINKHNNHTLDQEGKEYDEDGMLIYDPTEKND